MLPAFYSHIFYSSRRQCALFTSDGGLVANAPHIPVHLGAMQSAVRFQVEYWNSEGRDGIKEGDVFVSNHPQLAGGSHLPDSEFWTIPVACIFL